MVAEKPKRRPYLGDMVAPPLPLHKPGQWVAHYSKADTVFLDILPSGELLLNKYRNMRDPVENKDPTFFGLADLFNNNKPSYREFREQVAVVRNDAQLTSLTHDVDGSRSIFGCAWARPRMWEQYGDLHRGACMVFKRDRFQAALDTLEHDTTGHPVAHNVRYTESGIAGWSPKRPDTTDADALWEFVRDNSEALFFLKTDDWQSEHEYRVVAFPAKPDAPARLSLPYGDALEAVVLGELFSEWQIPGALQLCTDYGIELRRIQWRNGRPTTVLVEG